MDRVIEGEQRLRALQEPHKQLEHLKLLLVPARVPQREVVALLPAAWLKRKVHPRSMICPTCLGQRGNGATPWEGAV